MKKLIYLIIVLLIAVSCKTESSDDIDVSNVYQAYLLSYNKTANHTHACAQFRDGGALGNDIILDSPSKIAVNGEVLTHQDFPYALYYHYYKKYSGEQSEVTFVFTDKNNKEYTNIANLNTLPSINKPDGFIEISKSDDFDFVWIGEPVGSGETVQLTLSDSNESGTYSQSDENATSITIAKNDLAQFQQGQLNFILTRYNSNDIQQSTGKGGAIMLEYSVNGTAMMIE